MNLRTHRPSTIVIVLGAALAVGASPSLSAAVRPFDPDDTYLVRTAADLQLSPDGARIVFVERSTDRAANRSRSQLWLVGVADGVMERLTPPAADDTSPRWSPDGTAVASLSTEGGKPVVVVTRLDGTRQVVAAYRVQQRSPRLPGRRRTRSRGLPTGGARVSVCRCRSRAGRRRPLCDHPLRVYKSWASMTDNRRWHIYVVTLADKQIVQVTKGLSRIIRSLVPQGRRDRVHLESRAGPRSRSQLRHLRGPCQPMAASARSPRRRAREYAPSWSA